MTMFICRLVAVFLLTAASQSAIAANWFHVSGAASKTKVWFFDMDTVVRQNGKITIWFKVVYNLSVPRAKVYSSTSKDTFDCSLRTLRETQSANFDQAGNMVGNL